MEKKVINSTEDENIYEESENIKEKLLKSTNVLHIFKIFFL